MHVDLNAEAALIGAAIVKDVIIDLASDVVGVQDFSDSDHRLIWSVLLKMRADGICIDVSTLISHLRERGCKKAQASWIMQFVDAAPTTSSAGDHARRIRDLSHKRRLVDTLKACLAEVCQAEEPAADLMAKVQAQVSALAVPEKWQPVLLKDAVSETLIQIEDAAKGKPSLIPTSLRSLDELIGGYDIGGLIILGARPSVGKTAFSLDMAMRVASLGRGSVLFFSQEMTRHALSRRILASRSVCSASSLRLGLLTQEDMYYLRQAAGKLQDLSFIIDDAPAISISRIARVCRSRSARGQLAMAFVDYLQILKPDVDKWESTERLIASFTADLKRLAKELKIPIMVLSQLNRNLESRENKEPTLSDLRHSGAIEQDADQVIFLHRPEMYNPTPENNGVMRIIVGKNRDGGTGKIDVHFDKEHQRFVER